MSKLKLIENYIYFHHLDKYCIIPQFPLEISDSSSANFEQTTILGRSAPIFTYANSGPRTVSFNLVLHRDLMSDISLVSNNFGLDDSRNIVEELINTLHSAVLPKYENATKAVNPPIVSVRIGDDIYIKGVVNGQVSHNYSGPIVDNKYQLCSIQFSITEIDPYDAESVKSIGSFRGFDNRLEKRLRGESGLL